MCRPTCNPTTNLNVHYLASNKFDFPKGEVLNRFAKESEEATEGSAQAQKFYSLCSNRRPFESKHGAIYSQDVTALAVANTIANADSAFRDLVRLASDILSAFEISHRLRENSISE